MMWNYLMHFFYHMEGEKGDSNLTTSAELSALAVNGGLEIPRVLSTVMQKKVRTLTMSTALLPAF